MRKRFTQCLVLISLHSTVDWFRLNLSANPQLASTQQMPNVKLRTSRSIVQAAAAFTSITNQRYVGWKIKLVSYICTLQRRFLDLKILIFQLNFVDLRLCSLRLQSGMGARRGWQGGHFLPPHLPWNLKKVTIYHINDSYAAVLQNTVKFSLASSVLALHTLYVGLKRCEKNKIFRFAFGSLKNGRIFIQRAKKRTNF